MAFLRDRSVFCIPASILDDEERYIIGCICMATSSLGFFGAALQVKSLQQYRDRQRRRPSPNPRIIYYLALSDMIACMGVFALAICLMTLERPIKVNEHEFRPSHNNLYAPLGTTIEIITLFAYLASYIWTLSYALDMCFQIHRFECSMTVYHILAWLIPLEFVITIECVNFGQYPNVCERYYGRLSRLILSYFPVMFVLMINPIIFYITFKKVKQLVKASGSYTVSDRDALISCKKKFFWIVIAFTACWLPNIFSVTYDLITYNKYKQTKSALDKLWFVEAFLNPLQGLFNYFVYRRSFKVTATDTRPVDNSLPRVSQSSHSRKFAFTTSIPGQKPSKNSDKHAINEASENEESPLLTSLPQRESTRPYVYITRLLGE